MKCDICRKHKATSYDYRFIESYGLQGKVAVCKWCRDLNDVAITEIIRNELNPKTYYSEKVE